MFSNVFTCGDSFSTPTYGWAALITEHYDFKYVNNQTISINGASTNALNAELNAYKTNVKTFDPNALYLMGTNDVIPIMDALQYDINE